VFLPRVLAKDPKGGLRPFDYDRDLLSQVDWEALRFGQRDIFVLDETETYSRTVTAISVEETESGLTTFTGQTAAPEALVADGELELAALTRLLGDVVANPWQATRILEETLTALRTRGANEAQLQAHRLVLAQAIRVDLRAQVNAATEKIFRELIEQGRITFRLDATNDPKLNASGQCVSSADDDRIRTSSRISDRPRTPLRSRPRPVLCG
jgi:type III restriction enzyme